jgi:dissimilatory sulfite reductase (desulfoviridin) alpha/beta subunit
VLYLGGNARERRLGTPFAKKIPRTRIAPVIAALLEIYDDVAHVGERFSATVARVGNERFFTILAQTLDETNPQTRDSSAALATTRSATRS